MSIIIPQTSFEPIPSGKYTAKITKISESKKFEENPQLQFSFELLANEAGDSRTICGWANQKFSPKSKLFSWTNAAIGPIERSYVFNSDDLLNKKVLISVVSEKRVDGSGYNKIVDVSPITQQTTLSLPTSEFAGEW